MIELLYQDETYKIIGACFEVYNRMGSGFLEPIYQECLELELKYQGILYVPQKELSIKYRDDILKKKYKPDFVCYDKIILEIKAISKLADEHRAAVLNYLNASNFQVGLLVNFGSHPKLEYERFVL